MPHGVSSTGERVGGINSATRSLSQSLIAQRPLEQSTAALQVRAEDNIENTANDRFRLRSAASSSTQQKFRAVGGRNRFVGNLGQTLRRAKARAQIVGRGDAAINNQRLKDRISVARQKLQRRGVAQGALGRAGNIRENLDVSLQQSKDTVTSAFAGAAGAIAGGAARGFSDRLFDTGIQSVTDETIAQGTGASDFGFGNSFSLDPANIGAPLGGVLNS